MDFGASDVVDFDDNENLIYIPTCLSAVAITYNIPGFPLLRLTPEIIAHIYLGNIRYWNDKQIIELNPEIASLHEEIVVIHRQESSGTTYIFSDYLSNLNTDWKKKIGRGKSLSWPVGMGAKGNEGIITRIMKTPFSIAYVGLEYTLKNNLPAAAIKNNQGFFIKPDLESVSVTGNVRVSLHKDFSITNISEPRGYPITSFTWILVQKEQFYNKNTRHHTMGLYNLLSWIITYGQFYTTELFYAPLPGYAKDFAMEQLNLLTYKHQPLYKIESRYSD
ncbi:MAG: phosphate ABC transporter substrate-binding protein PstS [Spirochaetales bacterium]|nr:phosphate ABC transporter substrate-binding protein PstS [Spirochaetales bacterium]